MNFFGTPLIASQQGAGVDKLLWLIHALMALLFVGWLVYFLYVIVRFRQKRNPRADHVGVRSHFSSVVEVGVAVFEGALLIGLAVPLWADVVDKFPAESASTVIEVSGRQFNWTGRYSGPDGQFARKDANLANGDNPWGIDAKDPAAKDDITVINDLVVPVEKPVLIKLTSLDVIHSFAVHPMRITQDAIPGMMIPTHFTPTKEGLYNITCAQLCGNSHYSMRGTLKVVSAAEYDTWVKSKVKSSAAGGEGYE